MAKQVEVATLNIDYTKVIKASGDLKRDIDELKKAQKSLDTQTKEGSNAFAANETRIKQLSKSYRDNQKFATSLDSANKNLTKTMSTQNKSTQELRDSRSQLIQISNNIQGNTEEEIKLRDELTQAIDDQTEALRDQSSGYTEAKDGIGEYTDGINRSDISIQGFIKSSQEAGGAGKALAGGVKQSAIAMGNLTKATLKFILTPVGAILAVIVGAFLLVKNAMDRSEESTNKIKKGFAGFGGAVKGLLKLLQPLGDFLIDGLVKGLELVEKGISKTFGFIQKALVRLGFDDAAKKFENFTDAIAEAAESSKQLTQAELEYNKAQRISRKTQLDYQKTAEKLRQIRDDESKSTDERIKANEQLGKTLNNQLNVELALAQKALDLANLRVELDGQTEDNLNEQAAALTEIADIEERIEGQRSEQLVNRVSLEKEAAEEIKAIKDAELEKEKEILAEKEKIAEEAREKAIEELALENERLAIDAQNKFDAAAIASDNMFALKQDDLNRQRLAEIQAAEQTGADVNLINQKYAALDMRLSEDVTDFKQQQNAAILSGLSALFSESSILGKAFAVAEITNNTLINATKAFSQASVFASNPLTAPLAVNAAIQGGIIVAGGVANVAKTTGIKLAKGGMVSGEGTSTSDSIPALLSNGESVNNAKSTGMFAPIYSYLNQLGGGDKFANGGVVGSTSVSNNPIINYDVLAGKIAEANQGISLNVGVDEITRVTNNVNVIENIATF